MKSVGWEKHRLQMNWMHCFPGTRRWSCVGLFIERAIIVRLLYSIDKTALKNFFSELTTRLSEVVDPQKKTYVFDGGGTSEEVLEMIPGNYITRGSLKSSLELSDVPRDSYEEVELTDDVCTHVTAYRGKAVQFGKERTVIISLSEALKDGQVSDDKLYESDFAHYLSLGGKQSSHNTPNGKE